MKYKLLFLFIITINLYSYSQFNAEPYGPTKIVLKNGDTLTGEGKTKNKGYKFRPNKKAEPYFIDFSTIDYIEQTLFNNDPIIFKFFQLNDRDKYIRVEEDIVDGPVQSYSAIRNYTATMEGFGSVPMSTTIYYVKKKNEDKLTKLGTYDPIIHTYQTRVRNYFKDCPKLIEQINNKKLRFQHGLGKMVKYYNENCISELNAKPNNLSNKKP